MNELGKMYQARGSNESSRGGTTEPFFGGVIVIDKFKILQFSRGPMCMHV